MNRRETLRVEISQPKVRLDKFLQKKFSDISRGTFQRLIQDGNVLVDGKTTKTTHHPKACEEIMITWPNPQPSEVLSENIPFEVLFEDECLLVINKPPGIVVHPAAGHTHGTLVNALLHHCAGELSGVGGVARPGIVHRLDKDTSTVCQTRNHQDLPGPSVRTTSKGADNCEGPNCTTSGPSKENGDWGKRQIRTYRFPHPGDIE